MASCVVVYADGCVQVVEADAGFDGGVWLGVRKEGRGWLVCFGSAALGRGDAVAPRSAKTPLDVIQEWAVEEGVLSVIVNGEQVWPFPDEGRVV